MGDYEYIEAFIDKCKDYAEKKYKNYTEKKIQKICFLDNSPPDLRIYIKEKNELGLYVKYKKFIPILNKSNLLDYYILDDEELKEKYGEKINDGYRIDVFRYAETVDEVVYVGQYINTFNRFKRLLDFFFEKEYEKNCEVKVERRDGRVIFEIINK